MKKPHPKRENFTYLTAALMMFMLIGSLTHEFLDVQTHGTVLEVALVLTLATGVWSVKGERPLFALGIGLTGAIVLVSVANYFLGSPGLNLAHMVLLLGFLLLTAWVAVRQVVFSGHVDRNEIVGSVCLYLMIGVIWAVVFLLVEKVVPGSFNGLGGEGTSVDFFSLIYFSFVTLTTLGFGDITPSQPLARYLTIMEGVLGQLYLVILVARLVGLYTAQESERRSRATPT